MESKIVSKKKEGDLKWSLLFLYSPQWCFGKERRLLIFMREILFRGKTEDGRWVEGCLVKGTFYYKMVEEI